MRFALFLLACALPGAASAATVERFDFASPPHDRWSVQGWTGVQRTAAGFAVHTARDGAWVMQNDDPFRAQAVTLETSAHVPTDALILWDQAGGTTEMVQLPVVIPGGDVPSTQTIDLTRYPEWNPDTRRFGIALPAGADVTLRSLALRRYAVHEKMAAAVQSLATADTFQAFSINFLWGPLIAFTPEALAHLYEGQPPNAWSAMRFVAPVLLLAAVWATVRKRPRTVVTAFVALWLLLDLRMGGELIGYAVTDWRTYLTRPPAQRVLRDREHYYASVEQSAAWLMEEPAFGFLSSWPVLGSVRYFTYPSVPVTPDDPAHTSVRRWLVFSEPQGGIDAEGRLLLKGVPVSQPGAVVRTFGSGAFLFEVR